MDNGGEFIIFATDCSTRNKKTMSVAAQEKVNAGSFILSTTNEGDLVKGTMYRVKGIKSEGKYVTLDTDFCGTESLKGKTITFNDRFRLLDEEEVKSEFKKMLNSKGFITGQEFLDVRTGNKVVVETSSRTHILAKFGRFMGVKVAGGHVWFAGKKWADPMVGTDTMPDQPTDEQAIPTELPSYYALLVETKEQAIHVANHYAGRDAESWINYWSTYEDQTVFFIDGEELDSYADLLSVEATPVITYEDWKAVKYPEPKKEVKSKRKLTLGTGGTIEEQILAVVDEHLESDEAKQHMAQSVESLLNKWGIDKNVRQLEVKVNDKPIVKVGQVHFKYDLVLRCMMARTNVALVGAAGSGKTTTVAKAAEALELPFYSKSVSAQTGAHEFFGYQDAQGRYVRTLFREAYENGGVFLLDEFDAGNPNVLAALNQATANEHCAFADGMIPKHEDFICVMAGNTFGHGANSEYVGRNKIDAATLDRFAFIDFPYDEDLEYALASNKDWCKKVQAFRRKVEQKRIRTIVSPRATIIGGQLLSNGVTEKDVMELLIYKGLNQEERNLLKG